MTLCNFIKRLKENYRVEGLYYVHKDIVALWFYFEKYTVQLQYSGQTIRDSIFTDMLKRVEDDLESYKENI